LILCGIFSEAPEKEAEIEALTKSLKCFGRWLMRGATDAHGSHREATMTKQTGLDGSHRDKNGEISKKHPAARPVPQKKAA
jgi:hypothetical protein